MNHYFNHFLFVSAFVSFSLNIQAQGPYIIPVVFHILHENGPENIADSQVYDAMRILNDDFNKRNADTANVIPPFINLIADVGVQFQLASIDPNGNPTTGIDRIVTSLTDSNAFGCVINQWNPHHYLNVWTTRHGTGFSDYPPTADSFPNKDGIGLSNTNIGSIGTGSPFLRHILTHEVGHYLNLLHTWGMSNSAAGTCGDDSVQDTPITKGWIYCPTETASKNCDSMVEENYQNYMEYSYCSCMFTPGQKTRMINCLNSNMASRDSLWMLSNLIATGIVPTGIKDNSLSEISVYPNPFSSNVEIRGLIAGKYLFSVCDITGRTIIGEQSVQSSGIGKERFDLSAVSASGVYLMKVNNGESSRTFKLIKQ